MDAWLSRNYKTVILVLSVLLGWQLFDRLVPPKGQDRPPRTASSPARPANAGYTVLERQGESGYSISSTGKRHNSGCRFYNPAKPCGSGDGVACKICGG
jgi:hypothetical protein